MAYMGLPYLSTKTWGIKIIQRLRSLSPFGEDFLLILHHNIFHFSAEISPKDWLWVNFAMICVMEYRCILRGVIARVELI